MVIADFLKHSRNKLPLKLRTPIQFQKKMKSSVSSNTGETSSSSGKASHKYTNRLIHEKSPYLLQHAHNPVDWHPWGDSAFQATKSKNLPIFLSVGYSTCHWCHVMERESFENESVAKIMNEHFINVKVDREERPTVDKMYMNFVTATTGHGGWPMSVWLTPDLKPFYGGTYYPPEDRFGSVGFKTLLMKIAELWNDDPSKVNLSGDRIIESLKKSMARHSSSASSSNGDFSSFHLRKSVQLTYDYFENAFDDQEGGFGGRPKFPTPSNPLFILDYAHHLHRVIKLLNEAKGRSETSLKEIQERFGLDTRQSGEELLMKLTEEEKNARFMIAVTAKKINEGGIHDHIGSGFHRYSVDQYWHVPHFEKMLYDQAQLLKIYSRLAQECKETDIEDAKSYKETVRDIIHYMSENLKSEQGGFYSAEDADSFPTFDSKEKKEGAFAVWEKGEIEECLKSEEMAEIFCYHYGVEDDGNVPPMFDPNDELSKKNVLIQRHSLQETAEHFKMKPDHIENCLIMAKRKLLVERKTRPKPHLDDKIITSLNGLTISGLVEASFALHDQEPLILAENAAEFIKNNLYNKDSKRLLRSFREGPSDVHACSDDYAFMIEGLLSLYQATFNPEYLVWAIDLQNTMNSLFWDKDVGGYFNGPEDDNTILIRMKDDHDAAEPSSNSVAYLNLRKLALITDEPTFDQYANKTREAFGQILMQTPYIMSLMASGELLDLSQWTKLVVKGDRNDERVHFILKKLREHYMPSLQIVLLDTNRPDDSIVSLSSIYINILDSEYPFAIYLCQGTECGLPILNVDQFVNKIPFL